MRRIVPAAVLATAGAAAALLAGPAAAHHDCPDDQAEVHVRNPRTGAELAWACVPNPEMRNEIIGECPPGSSGMVVYLPLFEPIYFCEGP